MSERIPVFGGSMAQSYDRYLGPILFEPYARDLAARLPSGFGGRVLELAAGTGIVTRAILSRLGLDAQLVATDLSPKMLEFAMEKVEPDTRLTWQTADALDLPFEDKSFDAMVCQFGAMFFPDKLAAFREARRVLKPGGKLLFSVWAELPENPVFYSMELALRAEFPDEPTPILASPSNMADPEPVKAQLLSAGFETVGVDRVGLTAAGAPALDVFFGFALGTPTSTFLTERGLALDDAQTRLAPIIAQHLGDPIDTTMVALVFDAE